MDRRRFGRVKDRWLCELQINGQKIRGVVLNLSADGLFVNVTPPVLAGTDVLVELRSPDGERYSIVGVVRRLKRAPPALAAVAERGLEIRIRSAPEGYFQAVAGGRTSGRK